MEEAVYKELKSLCQKILDKGSDVNPSEYLKELRVLEEKLILLDYLQFRSRSFTERPTSSTPDLDAQLMDTLKAAEQQFSEPITSRDDGHMKMDENSEALNPEPEAIIPTKEVVPEIPEEEVEQQRKSLNESLASDQIKLGLNDRLAFTKYLFAGSQEDLNRVMSQINTFETYSEAEVFIAEMVKPDYDWSEHSDYEQRLFELVKARFGVE